MRPTTTQMPTTTMRPTTTTISNILYQFTSHIFNTAGKIGPNGPTLDDIKNAYNTISWAQNTNFLNMYNNDGIQLWKVPKTGSYKIRAVGAGVPYSSSYTINQSNEFQKGMDVSITVNLTMGEIIKILVGQMPINNIYQNGGAGGTFIVSNNNEIILIAGGAGGRGGEGAIISSNASRDFIGNNGSGSDYWGLGGLGGDNGSGGMTSILNSYAAGGGGFNGNGQDGINAGKGGKSFINGGTGGSSDLSSGGFGGGGGVDLNGGGGGGGGYSGGGSGAYNGIWSSGGGGGSYSMNGTFESATANNNENGFVVITLLI